MRRFVLAAVLLAVLAAVDVIAHVERRQYDLTAEKTLTLSPVTEAVVDSLDRRVQFTSFVRRDDPARVAMTNLLSRYRRLDRRISFRILDPDDAPAEAQRLGVDPATGGTAIVAGGEREVAPTPTEQDLTAALARLLRPGEQTVCVTAGHGEPPNGAFHDLLAQRGYRVERLDLLRSPDVPTTCLAVVVAGPTEQPSDEVLDSLRRELDDGGRLLVLAEPGGSADLSAVTQQYGIVLERGLVLEGNDDNRPAGDPFRPIVSEYRSAHPVVQRLAPTMFPTVQGVLADAGTRGGLTVTPLARTSELSFLERRPAAPGFDEGEDLPGPIVVAAAADHSIVEGDEVRRSRVIVVGDADFISDDFLGVGANTSFVTRSLDWLTLDEDIVSVEANIPALRPIELTEGRLAYARLLGAGIVPALFLLGGALTWALRRSR